MTDISTKTDKLARVRHNLEGPYLDELERDSAISLDVIAERGYLHLTRPRPGYDNSPDPMRDSRRFLTDLGFPTWSTREDYYFPGLWIPGWDVHGRRFAGQWKPWRPVRNRDGKAMKYASAKGAAARLDVHPRWTRDRGADDPALLPAIRDASIPLWITEGAKKADSLTSREVCTVALPGVFNWRNSLGTLGDWEDVALKGREITICFDADASTKPAVAQAMDRLGRWLKHKGAAKVWYLVVPGEVVTPGGVTAVKGADDYFAAGGTLKHLEQSRATRAPEVKETQDTYTDSRLAETIAHEVLTDRYVYVPAAKGGTWHEWDGRRWCETHEVTVQESVRQWALDRFAAAAEAYRDGKDGAAVALDGLRTMLGAARQRAVLGLTRGIAEVQAATEDFDPDPDLINTPAGIVDLRTDEIMPHSPDFMMTRITGAAYVPGATHPAWDAALAAVPADALEWLQVRIGQAATGHQADDGRMVLLTGTGDNGKTLLMGNVFRALGGGEGGTGYATKVPNTLLLKGKTLGAATPEKMTLRGTRLAYIEETPEESYLDSNVVKEILDAEIIDGRELYKGTTSFRPGHSLFLNTNHPPIVSDTGHGAWRRLSRIEFPFSYLAPHKPLLEPTDRYGDAQLKRKLQDPAAQEAVLAWVIDGARRWYAAGQVLTKDDPEPVALALHEWRMKSDVLLRFLTERVAFDPDRWVSSADLYGTFRQWLKDNGHKDMTSTTFKAKLSEHSAVPGYVTFARKLFSGPGWSAKPAPPRAEHEPAWMVAKPPATPARGVAVVGVVWSLDE